MQGYSRVVVEALSAEGECFCQIDSISIVLVCMTEAMGRVAVGVAEAKAIGS